MPLRRKPEVVYATPPAEPSALQKLADAQSRIDAAIRLCDEHATDPRIRDAVLDIRLALRPAVPVVPGRSS